MIRRKMRRFALGVAVWLLPGIVQAQPARGADISPGEVERLFDAFVLVQAQEALELTDQQFPRFVSALKPLQELRRTREQERRQLLATAQRLATRGSTTEAAIEEHLEKLDAQSRESEAAIRAAYGELDAVLSPRQRVRYRFFEQRMERRKLELVMQARGARGNGGARHPRAPTPQRRARPD